MLRYSRLFLVLLLISITSMLASAQDDATPTQVVVSYAEVTEGQNEVSQLGLYFTFADGNGRPLPADSANDATIVVTGNGVNLTEEARVEEPNTPLYVVILLDASGSMQASAADMRRAAIEAVNALPDGTQFSLMTFNRDISTGTPFTRTKNEIINLIGTYQPASPSDANAGTCLFDAAFAALDKTLEAPLPARRTVMLFTDGRDELRAGVGDTCSTRTLDEVITKATNVNDPVSINTIGLRGAVAIDEAALRSMAESSKGFAAIGALSELNDLFQQIVDGLNNQRVALADFCLPRGQYIATLVTQPGFDVPQLSDTFSFNTDLQCTPATATPAAQPIIRLTRKVFDPATGNVTLQIGGENLDQITRYSVIVTDPTGATIDEFLRDGGPNPEPIEFSMEGLPDGRITVDIVAIRFDGQTLQTDDELSVLRPTATPTPSITPIPSETPTPTLVPVGVNLQSILYEESTDTITLNIVYTDASQVSRVRIDIIDARGFNKASIDRGELIEVEQIVARDIGLVPDEQYVLRVEAFNAAGQSLNRLEQGFTYVPVRTATPAPTETPVPTETPTPVVFTANIDAISYDAANDLLQIRLTLENNSLMGDIELLVLDSNNVLIDTVVVDPVSPISYPGAKLIPQAGYTFRLKATDLNGRVVANSELGDFTYPRVVTATPTQTATPTETIPPSATPTATPIVTALEFVGLEYRIAEKVLAVQFTGDNIDQIARYRFVLNDSGGVVIDQRVFESNTPGFEIPLDLSTGEFQLVVTALDAQDRSISSFERSFQLNVPTPTPTPTPTLLDRVRENPLIGVLIVVIVLALVGLLVFLIMGGRRERAKAKNTAASLPSMTGAIMISRPDDKNSGATLPGASNTPSSLPNPAVNRDEPTMRPGMLDNERTNAMIAGVDMSEKTNAAVVATGFLKVTESGEASMVGKIIPLMSSPFFLGRTGPRNNNANFDGDKNVSRAHAELTLESGTWILNDNGSALGTTVNGGDKITGRIPLSEGDTIRLGGTTVLVFTRKG